MKHRSKLYDIPKDELQQLCDSSSSKAEILDKLKMSRHGGNHATLKKVFDEYQIDETKLNQNKYNHTVNHMKQIHSRVPIEDIIYSTNYRFQSSRLKDRLIEEGYKKHQCENCLKTVWLGQPIPLQLHHKDGNHNNNYIDNLQLLCPNCHTLTDTFAGKKLRGTGNKQKRKSRPAKRGLSEDGTKLYDGYGNFKIICPVCHINYKNRASKMCQQCYDYQRNIPKIDKDVLRSYIKEGMSYNKIGQLYRIDKDTVRKYLAYYAINEPINDMPERNELKQNIRKYSIHDICHMYNISKNKCIEWYRLYGIPYLKVSISQINDEKWGRV